MSLSPGVGETVTHMQEGQRLRLHAASIIVLPCRGSADPASREMAGTTVLSGCREAACEE